MTDTNIQQSIGSITGQNVSNIGQQIINHLPERKRGCPPAPRAPEHFGGRDQPLSDLTEKLKQGTLTAITAVQGLGGMGKTTLAQKLAHDLHQDGTFGAVLWTHVTRKPDPTELLSTWARYVDPTFDPAEMPLGQIAAQTRYLLTDLFAANCPGRVLVVLDDVWDNGLQTARLLRDACPPNSTVLMTTRSTSVAVDLGAEINTLGRLTPDEGVAMLHEYLPGADADLLAELVTALGGHALALELAARRIKKRTNQGRELRQSLDEYKQGIPKGDLFSNLKLDQGAEQEDNLTLSLWLSYLELDEEAKARFRALGVLAYDVPVWAATLAALWGTDLRELDDWSEATTTAEGHADDLCLLALLDTATIPGEFTYDEERDDLDDEDDDRIVYRGNWYALHPLLRSLARSFLRYASQPGELAVVTDRYTDHIVSATHTFINLKPEEWDVLAPMLPHVHEVGDRLTERYQQAGDHAPPELTEQALAFAANTSQYLGRRLEVQRNDWVEMGLTAARQLNKQDSEAIFLRALGYHYGNRDDPRRALGYYEESLRLHRLTDDKMHEAATLTYMGKVWRQLGEPQKALACYEQALPLHREVRNIGGQANTLGNMARVWSQLGEKRKALDLYEQALQFWREDGEIVGEATILSDMGLIYAELGDYDQALAYCEQALPLARSVGNRGGEAMILTNIGGIWSARKDERKALTYYEQALLLAQSVGATRVEASLLDNMGVLWGKLGDLVKSETYIEQSLALRRQIEDREGIAGCLNNLSSIYWNRGEPERAVELMRESLGIVREIGQPALEAALLINMAIVLHLNLSRTAEAIPLVRRSIALLRQYNLPQDSARQTLPMHRFMLGWLLTVQVASPRKNLRRLRSLFGR